MKKSLASLLAIVVVGNASGAPPSPPVLLKGVTVPIYVSGEPQAVVAIHMKATFKDYERRGFFRIGALPILVAEDVRVDILQPAGVGGLFRDSREWLEGRAQHVPLEWRHVVLTVPNERQPRLEAGRARLRQAGHWELSNGVTLRNHGGEKRLPRALLRMTSDGIVEVTAPPSTNRFRLFDFTTNQLRRENESERQN